MSPTSIPRVAMSSLLLPETGGGTTKRDVEDIGGVRNGGSRVELGPGRKAGREQNTMEFLGSALWSSTHEED